MGAPALPGNIARVILYVRDVSKVAAFYRDKLGLQPLAGQIEGEWVELQAGDGAGCALALHKTDKLLSKGRGDTPKIVFAVRDVAAGKELLVARGVKIGKIYSADGIEFCGGRDPEGNRFQISNRGL